MGTLWPSSRVSKYYRLIKSRNSTTIRKVIYFDVFIYMQFVSFYFFNFRGRLKNLMFSRFVCPGPPLYANEWIFKRSKISPKYHIRQTLHLISKLSLRDKVLLVKLFYVNEELARTALRLFRTQKGIGKFMTHNFVSTKSSILTVWDELVSVLPDKWKFQFVTL